MILVSFSAPRESIWAADVTHSLIPIWISKYIGDTFIDFIFIIEEYRDSLFFSSFPVSFPFSFLSSFHFVFFTFCCIAYLMFFLVPYFFSVLVLYYFLINELMSIMLESYMGPLSHIWCPGKFSQLPLWHVHRIWGHHLFCCSHPGPSYHCHVNDCDIFLLGLLPPAGSPFRPYQP